MQQRSAQLGASGRLRNQLEGVVSLSSEARFAIWRLPTVGHGGGCGDPKDEKENEHSQAGVTAATFGSKTDNSSDLGGVEGDALMSRAENIKKT